MTKLDTNLDACQLSGEILIRLRKIIREGLRTAYGKTWNEAGIPGDIREFLTQRQAREASINWNLSDSVDVLDFAGYLNLYDIAYDRPETHVIRRPTCSSVSCPSHRTRTSSGSGSSSSTRSSTGSATAGRSPRRTSVSWSASRTASRNPRPRCPQSSRMGPPDRRRGRHGPHRRRRNLQKQLLRRRRHHLK